MQLMAHQQDALAKLRNGSILMGGTGSGKSRTALAYFYTKICGCELNPFDVNHVSNRLIIITTAKKRDSLEWNEEINAFGINTNVIIDSWNNIKNYRDVEDAFFIFDEQRVSGNGAWTKTFIRITKNNQWILLSATPGDTWMDYIPVMIANGYYENRSDFIKQHVVYKRFAKYPIIDHYINVDKLYSIRECITVPMYYKRATISHDKYIYAMYDRDKYNRLMRTKWNEAQNRPVDNISELMAIARKIVNSDDSRIDEFIKVLSTCRHGAIVFYNYDYELDAIKKALVKHDINFSEWNGHKHERANLGNPNTAYLVQYLAGCEGWECITTNTIIFFSQTYSYKTLTQAKGRIDRLNTPYEDLYYYHIISAAPLDKGILKCLKRKENFNERVFAEGDI